ncbi:MAG: hypothetical protein ACYCVZ_16030 [Streptosporangiaceae bacterium]
MAGRKGTPQLGSGIDAGSGEWVPAFPGQRPPFAPGNTYAVRHGASRDRFVAPLAAEIEAELKASPVAPWLADPELADDVAALARAMAIGRLLDEYLDRSMSVTAAMDVLGDPDAGRAPVLEARAVMAALEQARLASGRASRLRSRLGLDPLAVATAPAGAKWLQVARRMGLDPQGDFRAEFGPGLRAAV